MTEPELPEQIIGGSIIVNGSRQMDGNSELIHRLITNRFTRLVDSESDWTTLFRDPVDGRYWELSYPNGGLQGGGAKRLDAKAECEVISRYGRLPDQDEWIAAMLQQFELPQRIVGGTIVHGGRTIDDQQSDLIQMLVRNRFERVTDREQGWTELYRDRVSSGYFELSLRMPSLSERRPLRLDSITPDQVLERYGRSVDR